VKFKTAVSILKFSLLVGGTAFSSELLAQTATDLNLTFGSRTYFSSGTALWNQAAQIIQPTLIVKDWNSGGGNQTSTIEVGDGSDGAFNSSTWSRFGTVDSVNKIIYFDNSAHSPLQATTFTLDAGWTLIPTKDQPLKIDVLGDATVNGVIECSGADGGSVTGIPGSAGAGGAGRCGGGSGGAGGAVRTGTGAGAWDGSSGTGPSTSISGGTGGSITNGTAGAGGGGGGAFGSATPTPALAAANGGNGTATAGALGARHLDPAFTEIAGGAGGGGGSGSSTQAGAGGGGGGGVIILHVAGNLTIGTNGFIRARGGNGGVTSSDGGEGGSGGGGSIQTWVGKGISLLSSNVSDNAIDASGGANSSGSASRGGDGWNGRTWTASDSTGSGFTTAGAGISPAADVSMTEGFSYSTSGSSQNVITTAIDTQSTLATFNSASFTSTKDADVTLEVAGSNDAFASDDTGWMSTANVADLNNKRYVRFRLSINNSDEVNPTTVSQVTINYTPGLRTDFDFTSAGCGRIDSGSSGSSSSRVWSALLLLLPLLTVINLRARQRQQSRMK
jgi:hypothetical protein